MKLTYITFDLMGLLLLIGCVLLMIGVVPFTPVAVGVLLIVAKCELTWTWDRS